MTVFSPSEYPIESAFAALLHSVGLGKKAAQSAALHQHNRPGDLAAFNRLVLDNQDVVFNLTCYLLGDPDLAEDVTQKAFIKAYLQFHQFNGQSFRAWILAIARNVCYDELRKLKSRPALSLDALDNEDSDWSEWLASAPAESAPEAAVETRERQAAVYRALQALSADFRSAVVLVDLQGLDYQEAAQVLGIPIGTLKSRLARARRQLTEQPELAGLTG